MLPAGDLRPPYYGHWAVMEFRAILQHQVVQTALNRICFRLVVARPLSQSEEQHVIMKATEALGGGLQVSLDYVTEIVRGPNGKCAEFQRLFSLPSPISHDSATIRQPQFVQRIGRTDPHFVNRRPIKTAARPQASNIPAPGSGTTANTNSVSWGA